MDSQLTLVNATPPICLTFSRNSMINTTLFRDETRHPAYTLTTELRGSATNLHCSATGKLLARVTRRELLPDVLAFPDIDNDAKLKEVRLSKWMRRCKLPDGSHAHIIVSEMGNCVLKKDLLHRLALFTEYDLSTPIAHWDVSVPGSLSLVLYPGTENFHPQILVAFTVQELKMRMAEKADLVAQSRAAAQSKTLVNVN
ncbi:peptide methionine sulfoxide reductase [Favolaschia claudopus]|uniref:Peptide methionine sulfoxide reductase n=1 Tax=Favolaschia claudopus TaxID=2862362 RepID=A0AAW0CN37_9AGAR